MNNHNHISRKDSEIIYTCPRHPEIRRDRPGLCPECGRNLIESKARGAELKKREHTSENQRGSATMHDKHAEHSTNIFKAKFWVSLALSVPIVAYSDIAQKLLNYQAPAFPGSAYLPLALASVVFFYGGWVFIA